MEYIRRIKLTCQYCKNRKHIFPKDTLLDTFSSESQQELYFHYHDYHPEIFEGLKSLKDRHLSRIEIFER